MPQKRSSLEMEGPVEQDRKRFKTDRKVKGKVVGMAEVQEKHGKLQRSTNQERGRKSMMTGIAKQKSDIRMTVPEKKCFGKPVSTGKGTERITKDHKTHKVSQTRRNIPEQKSSQLGSDDMVDFTAIENKIFENITGDHKRVVQRLPKERKGNNRERRSDQGMSTNKQKKGGEKKTNEKWKECHKKETGRKSYESIQAGSSKGNGSPVNGKVKKQIRGKNLTNDSATPSFDKTKKRQSNHSASTSAPAKGGLGSKMGGKKSKPNIHKGGRTKEDLDSDSELSDWEEVDEVEEVLKEVAAGRNSSSTQQQNVQVVLDAPVLWGMRHRRKKKTEDELIEDYLRKQVNRGIKELYENMHKCHVLCLFAHGRFVNMTLNMESLLGAALSIVTNKECYPPKRLDINFLEKFVKWFRNKIEFIPEEIEANYWSIPLEEVLRKRLETKKVCSQREQVFLYVLMSRALGMSIRLVMSLQPVSWKPKSDVLIKPSKGSNDTDKEEQTIDKCIEEGLKEKKPNKKMLSPDSDEYRKSANIENKSKKAKSDGAHKTIERRSDSVTSDEADYDDESDFEVPTKKTKKSKSKSSMKQRKRSCDDVNTENKKKKKEPFVQWAEVYVEEEERWVCVDITTGKIHCVAEIESRSPPPLAYVVAYSNEQFIKDVTRRYVSSWLSSEKKTRCDAKWWNRSICSFRGPRTRLDKEEDKEMDQVLKEQPLPRTISEYKNHPMYALQRHLLKFESIYPPDTMPLGYIKGEPVFPRECVKTLYARETWIKEAKTVRVEEEPYKIVKARPKWDKSRGQVIKDRPLEVFGEWQVEDYEPPVARDGKVPRNEYGTVDLFKPCMLPKGCVHIPINGINRLAKKLQIDCALAMTGFDFHCGGSHPVYDGYIICEEFKDILLDAWNEEQVEQCRREEEKRLQRIYGNWKRLIKGMIVREQIKEKYGELPPPEYEKEKEEKKDSTDKKMKQTQKKKIKQEDIDKDRPKVNVTHKVPDVKIDLSMSVTDSFKMSRKQAMTKRNQEVVQDDSTTKEVCVKQESESEDEATKEKKKEKMKAALKWQHKTVKSQLDLSDDSEDEAGGKQSPVFSDRVISKTHPFYPSITATVTKAESKKLSRRTKTKEAEDSEEGSLSDGSTSCSESAEPDLKNRVRRKRAITNQTSGKYKEFFEEDEGDISVDDSDNGDKAYTPVSTSKKGISGKSKLIPSESSDSE
ncbi:DNA repair protein complementing XP-C cells homolog [Oratosquilla oratoria]|uniref:DNA repair protein complementing XP-C cells homolog n=1 Tax=Oratosquilla oratoria TaxID=337810 RepID=UPI003F777AC3